jgi:dephospho-CoA kinase
MIIGITGGTGCGKTTLLDVIRELRGMVLDCDAIYHQLLKTDASLLSSIEARFPGTVENGTLQRKKLGAIVFADKQALLDLNQITHHAVKEEVLRKLEEKPKLAAIDAIGLFESGINELCQLTVAVTAPIDVRIQRLMARDGISQEYAAARIAAQPSEEAFAQRCDYVLHNDGTKEAFREKCLAFLREQGIMKENL